MSTGKTPKGGAFILDPACKTDIYTPEQLPADVLEMGQAAFQFVESEVVPRIPDFEDQSKKIQTNILTMKKAGEQGLLMIEIPEEYGGLGMGLVATSYVSERMAQYGSFTVTALCHSGIGTMPLLYFGTAEQKAKYLPKLATAEWLAAYALTEANFGSDALGAKTKAVLSPDGKHYILNGEKVFITNGGFADVFTVYAKIDGEHFSAFIVEKSYPGVKIGPEEHKMGIKGSSTTTLILEDVPVPVENLLGKIGEGHKSALGVLDIGRYKLGIGVMGNCKRGIGITAAYANERRQFKQPISNFGMIRRKLADMAARIYAVESMGYRTAGMIDDVAHTLDRSDPDYVAKVGHVFEEYDVECAIMKVMGSECAAFCADEAVQIHGGYGFIEEYECARTYRDERINRIFEGTNEVNRLLVPATLLKRSMTGRAPVMPEYMKLVNAARANPAGVLPTYEGVPLGTLARMAESARLLTLYAFGSTLRKNMAVLQKPEFVLGMGEYYFEKLANMIMHVFALDSVVRRAQQILAKVGEEKAANAVALTHVAAAWSWSVIRNELNTLIGALAEGKADEIQKHLEAVAPFTYAAPMNLVAMQDRVAAKIVDTQKYSV
jgi:alkylation response protein AidB-like acyl-CoA dehydrogenase